MKRGVRDFFADQFSAGPGTGSKVFCGMEGSKLSESDRTSLEKEFSKEKIKRAIWDCGVEKCPGPNGFNFHFFRQFWEILKGDFENLFAKFYSNSKLVRVLNSSFITLIPKKANPLLIEEYQPISLIGGPYKVVAMVLSNRITKVVGASPH